MDNLNLEIQTLDEQRQMRNLANAVRLSDSFSLLFVRCNQRPRQKEIIEELKGELAGYKIKVIFLENQIEHLLDELQARLGDEKPDAVFVYGLESSFPKADEAAESKFVVTLNHSRNSFKRVLNCPLVLFLPEYALSAIYHGATDFYSIRSGVYLFSAKAEETEALMSRHASQSYLELDGLLVEERNNRIRTIKELITEYQSLPQSQRDNEREFSLKDKLAELYFTSGDYETVENIRNELILAARNSENAVLLARNLSGLSVLYERQRNYDAAIIAAKEASEIAEAAIGSNHHDYAITLVNLALAYVGKKEFEKAIKLYDKALSILEKTLGSNHPIYSSALNNQAIAYQKQGRIEEALSMFEKSIDITKQTLGVNHLDYANRLSNLAHVYLDMRKYGKASDLFAKTYQICLKILGAKHHRTKFTKEELESSRAKLKEQASLIVPYKK